MIRFEARDFLSDQLCKRSHYSAIPGSISHFRPTLIIFIIMSGMKFWKVLIFVIFLAIRENKFPQKKLLQTFFLQKFIPE